MRRRFVLSLLVSALLVIASLALLPVGVQADEEQVSEFAMHDGRALETTGAGGSGIVAVDEDGEMELRVRADSLRADHDYDVVVTIRPASAGADPSQITDVLRFATSSNDDAKLRFKVDEVDLGLDAGTYRIDFFVTHGHGPVFLEPAPFDGTDTNVNEWLRFKTQRDVLLSCSPAAIVTIGADDDDEEDDEDGVESSEEQAQAVIDANARYLDVDNALADGFVFVEPSCTEGVGIHHLNPERFFLPLDPNKPTILMYAPDGEGGLDLVALEWNVPITILPGFPDVIPPPPELFGLRMEGPVDISPVPLPPFYFLHVGLDNPRGMFAFLNPEVTCFTGNAFTLAPCEDNPDFLCGVPSTCEALGLTACLEALEERAEDDEEDDDEEFEEFAEEFADLSEEIADLVEEFENLLGELDDFVAEVLEDPEEFDEEFEELAEEAQDFVGEFDEKFAELAEDFPQFASSVSFPFELISETEELLFSDDNGNLIISLTRTFLDTATFDGTEIVGIETGPTILVIRGSTGEVLVFGVDAFTGAIDGESATAVDRFVAIIGPSSFVGRYIFTEGTGGLANVHLLGLFVPLFASGLAFVL